VIAAIYRSMKLTKYRSHKTGSTLKSSLRTRRRSAARSMGASSVEAVGEAVTSWTTSPFMLEADMIYPFCMKVRLSECVRTNTNDFVSQVAAVGLGCNAVQKAAMDTAKYTLHYLQDIQPRRTRVMDLGAKTMKGVGMEAARVQNQHKWPRLVRFLEAGGGARIASPAPRSAWLP
jgi:hypothetical protein